MAIKLDPKNAKALNNLGVAFHQLGKDEKAAIQYHQALLLKPDFKEAKDNLDALSPK